jgi:hypothetical protein
VKRIVLISLRVAWLAICLSFLIKSQRAYRGGSDWKTEEYLAFEMMVLTFPASYLVAGLLILTGGILGLVGLRLPPPSKAGMTVDWLIFVLAGYLQWFLIVPILWRKTRGTVVKEK